MHIQLYQGKPNMINFHDFFEKYRELRSKLIVKPYNIPILIHCIEGIGRTGTFLAIDIILDAIQHSLIYNHKYYLNIFEVVYNLRIIDLD